MGGYAGSFHALFRMDAGDLQLGDVIGGFKAAVSREWRRGNTCVAQRMGEAIKEGKGEAGLAGTGRIWHRNYYELIVRPDDAEANIRKYIKLNPWRCVQDFGNGLRGMGNPALWQADKLGVLCSRNAPRPKRIPGAGVYLGGFHSPMEQATIFEKLLALERRVIWCPAWGLKGAVCEPPVLAALEENRLLILEMRNLEGDLAAAEARNRFVLERASRLWMPHVTPGGMLARLLKEEDFTERMI